MKTYGTIGLVVLLLAGGAQGGRTIFTLTSKGLVQAQPGLTIPLGPWNEGGTREWDAPVPAVDGSEGLVLCESDAHLRLGVVGVGESVASVVQAVEDSAARSLIDQTDGLDPNADWGTAGSWNARAEAYSDALTVNPRGRIALPTPGKGGWTPALLAATEEEFVMECVVFPALGAMIFVLAGRLLVIRVQKRRLRDRLPQLLQA